MQRRGFEKVARASVTRLPVRKLDIAYSSKLSTRLRISIRRYGIVSRAQARAFFY